LNDSVLYLSDKHDDFPDLLMAGSLSALKATNPLPIIDKVMAKTPNLHGEKMKQIAFAMQSNGANPRPLRFLHYALRNDGLFKVVVQILREIALEVLLHNRQVRGLLSLTKNKLIKFWSILW
jgi:hypothetical protein